ncbi:hypothetical protein IQ264_04740 [Phormidium sp. LEGE 05292]|uniref:hypothetical protein n=1 Tax=[Phormidium] sp. LEGE 05292 TaxID=767427 RepID=UPI001881BC21|nr:hypothetical protein [Phormidium sp. LEGE 05292]MBE9224774.1 hypothetical protein [Phormidium sp. LEGE 05292]
MLPLDESNAVGQPALILRQDIIITVLLLIREGWMQVCQAGEISVTSDEDTIAGALHNEMWAAKKRLGIAGPPLIVNEPASRASTESLKPDGFIDFKMFYGWGTQEDYFGIECKRISSTGTDRYLATEYIKNGIMRFITGIYSPGHDFAAMVGFVIDGKMMNCVDLVRERLSKYSNETCMEQDWAIEHDFGLQNDLYRTFHRQHGQSFLFRLLHLFLVID